ncbi:macro domain-like protein [Pisolithus croceorrhizus]|nr:macro domain-like protein [Pisolithus croceorrhizus]KAI6130125.1 macro domain-like protein [Pisolithus croceorrhizus]KAI6164590.1 macro domain-like protein [Pisolithus thermaeus]
MSNVSFILIEPPPRGPSNNTQASLITEWQLAFAQHLQPNDLERFSFLESRLDQLKEAQVTFDCVVSPANSYGIMDGGFDFYLSIAFSPRKDVFALTRLVQAAIRDRYYGFAPPGSCILVPGLSPNDFSCKVIAVCPTMRYPEELKWHKDIVYITMWSLLVQLETWNENADNEEKKIKKVLMTGLGTGVGKIPPAVCAKQMALAVKHFLHARSEEGQKSLAENDYLSWDRVLNLAKEV